MYMLKENVIKYTQMNMSNKRKTIAMLFIDSFCIDGIFDHVGEVYNHMKIEYKKHH